MSDPVANHVRTGIEVTAGFFRLAFLFFACAPRIEIDGVAHKKSWGTHYFEVPPGTHEVTVYFVYFFKPRSGENSISVEVGEGRVARVRYHAALDLRKRLSEACVRLEMRRDGPANTGHSSISWTRLVSFAPFAWVERMLRKSGGRSEPVLRPVVTAPPSFGGEVRLFCR